MAAADEELDLPALPETVAPASMAFSTDKLWAVMGGLAFRRQLLEDEVALLRARIAVDEAMIRELRKARRGES